MRRREFMWLVGGVAAWPHAALGQQGRPLRRIGTFIAANDITAAGYERALREGPEARGWVEGRTSVIAQRRVGTGINLREDVASLLAFAPDVIVAGSTSARTSGRKQLCRLVAEFEKLRRSGTRIRLPSNILDR